jgi:hypothetical protein
MDETTIEQDGAQGTEESHWSTVSNPRRVRI